MRYVTSRRVFLSKFIAFLVLIFSFVSLMIHNPFHDAEKEIHDLKSYRRVIDQIRVKNMKRMFNSTYLDYTGAGTYNEEVIHDYLYELSRIPFQKREDIISEVRRDILDFFGVSSNDYSVIFVSGATQALKVLGENFPFDKGSQYVYTTYNHNSVLGIRRYAISAGASFRSVDSALDLAKIEHNSTSNNLFVFPLEENFGGRKYSNDDINKIIKENPDWVIIGDAAAYLPTNPINLTSLKLNGIVLSFYKIFGFPNTGALIIDNKVKKLLQKRVFTSNSDSGSLEDDIPPFSTILAVKSGINFLKNLGMKNIQRHVYELTNKIYSSLKNLKHSNGVKAIEVYGSHEKGIDHQGGIVSFNIKRTQDSYFGYASVVSEASKSNIHLRGGCHCNPGACFEAVKLDESRVKSYYDAKTTCGDNFDIVDGIPLGAVRASFGWSTTESDIDRFVTWLRENYIF